MEQLVCADTLLGRVCADGPYPERASEAQCCGVEQTYVSELRSNEKAQLRKWYNAFCHWVAEHHQIEGRVKKGSAYIECTIHSHYIHRISLLVPLCVHIIEMHDLYCSFPFCPLSMRTTHISCVPITPAHSQETHETTNNGTMHFRRPLGGISCCSGCALQGYSPPACCPRAFALPVLTVIWHSWLLKLLPENHCPLHFPIWGWSQRDVSDEKIERGMVEQPHGTEKNFKESECEGMLEII